MSLPDHIKTSSKADFENIVATDATEVTGLIGIVSKYNENVLVGSHTTVWGSFFCTESKRWGFKCCKVTNKAEVKCKAANA